MFYFGIFRHAIMPQLMTLREASRERLGDLPVCHDGPRREESPGNDSVCDAVKAAIAATNECSDVPLESRPTTFDATQRLPLHEANRQAKIPHDGDRRGTLEKGAPQSLGEPLQNSIRGSTIGLLGDGGNCRRET